MRDDGGDWRGAVDFLFFFSCTALRCKSPGCCWRYRKYWLSLLAPSPPSRLVLLQYINGDHWGKKGGRFLSAGQVSKLFLTVTFSLLLSLLVVVIVHLFFLLLPQTPFKVQGRHTQTRRFPSFFLSFLIILSFCPILLNCRRRRRRRYKAEKGKRKMGSCPNAVLTRRGQSFISSRTRET